MFPLFIAVGGKAYNHRVFYPDETAVAELGNFTSLLLAVDLVTPVPPTASVPFLLEACEAGERIERGRGLFLCPIPTSPALGSFRDRKGSGAGSILLWSAQAVGRLYAGLICGGNCCPRAYHTTCCCSSESQEGDRHCTDAGKHGFPPAQGLTPPFDSNEQQLLVGRASAQLFPPRTGGEHSRPTTCADNLTTLPTPLLSRSSKESSPGKDREEAKDRSRFRCRRQLGRTPKSKAHPPPVALRWPNLTHKDNC